MSVAVCVGGVRGGGIGGEEWGCVAPGYKHGAPIPRVDYTPVEVGVWSTIYDKQAGLWEQYACTPFRRVVRLLESNVGFRRDNIPQLADVSDFLRDTTGFTLRPVTGLLSARDFLNALAFRVFGSTQYMRHHTRPLYTPEPDVVHELMGHAPMLAVRGWLLYPAFRR